MDIIGDILDDAHAHLVPEPAAAHEFAAAWTYRDPLVTVDYPKGWKGPLPAERHSAARKARVLVQTKRTRKKPAE